MEWLDTDYTEYTDTDHTDGSCSAQHAHAPNHTPCMLSTDVSRLFTDVSGLSTDVSVLAVPRCGFSLLHADVTALRADEAELLATNGYHTAELLQGQQPGQDTAGSQQYSSDSLTVTGVTPAEPGVEPHPAISLQDALQEEHQAQEDLKDAKQVAVTTHAQAAAAAAEAMRLDVLADKLATQRSWEGGAMAAATAAVALVNPVVALAAAVVLLGQTVVNAIDTHAAQSEAAAAWEVAHAEEAAAAAADSQVQAAQFEVQAASQRSAMAASTLGAFGASQSTVNTVTMAAYNDLSQQLADSRSRLLEAQGAYKTSASSLQQFGQQLHDVQRTHQQTNTVAAAVGVASTVLLSLSAVGIVGEALLPWLLQAGGEAAAAVTGAEEVATAVVTAAEAGVPVVNTAEQAVAGVEAAETAVLSEGAEAATAAAEATEGTEMLPSEVPAAGRGATAPAVPESVRLPSDLQDSIMGMGDKVFGYIGPDGNFGVIPSRVAELEDRGVLTFKEGTTAEQQLGRLTQVIERVRLEPGVERGVHFTPDGAAFPGNTGMQRIIHMERVADLREMPFAEQLSWADGEVIEGGKLPNTRAELPRTLGDDASGARYSRWTAGNQIYETSPSVVEVEGGGYDRDTSIFHNLNQDVQPPLTRHPANCLEHHSLHDAILDRSEGVRLTVTNEHGSTSDMGKFITKPYDPAAGETYAVRVLRVAGTDYHAVEPLPRCDNCASYGSRMGHVPTDGLMQTKG